MPKYHVEKSIQIDAPVEKVHALTNDFSQWPAWSPWLCMEPDANIDIVGSPGNIGHGYSWRGELTGAGEMQTTAHENGLHKMDLTFLKPFKSTAKITLDITSQGAKQTNVRWTMDSALPFFLFFMTNGLKTMIGMDYERGLKMLKDLAETGKVDSRLEIKGVAENAEIHYVGLTAESAMQEIGHSMEQTMPAIYRSATENQLKFTDLPAGAIYNNMDLKAQRCTHTAIIPVSEPAKADVTLPDGGSSGTIAAGKAIRVLHTGSYRHLGNAWSAAYAYQRYNKLKLLKHSPPYEIYLNDPQTTDESELRTEIFIPLKS